MIGYAMLYAAAVSMPVVFAATVVARFLQKHGRPERGVWIAAIAATLLLPAYMLSRTVTEPSQAWLPPVQLEVVELGAETAPVTTTSADVPPTRPLDLDPILAATWIVASLLLSARWIVSDLRLRRLSRTWLSDSIDGIPVAITSDLGPAVTGVRRPRVVVPAWVPALPQIQRALVLLHEQEHVRARDPSLITFARVAQIFTPWNPATWLLASRLKRAVELDCDRRVLRRHPNVEAYGETLLIVSARGSHRLLAAAAFAETDVPLRTRILAMTTPPRPVSVVGVLMTLAVGSILVSSAIAVPVPAVQVLPAPAVVLPRLTVGAPEEPASEMAGMDARPSAQSLEPVETADEPALFVSDEVSSSATLSRQVQTLPEPRVITDPRHTWLIVYRLSDFRAGGIGPETQLARFPIDLPPDSLWAIVRGMYGDSVVAITMERYWQSSPAPQTSIPPRVRNPDEVTQAIADTYPAELRDKGLGGTVGMLFLVGATGQVEEVRIGQVSAYPALDEAAMRVAGMYRFTPAMRGPDPVSVWVSHAISFYPPN